MYHYHVSFAVFLLEMCVRSFLVFTLTIQQFLIISPFVFDGFLGGLAFWTILYSRKDRKRAAMLLNSTLAEVTAIEVPVA